MRLPRPDPGLLGWLLFLFVLPFGEGSASPEGLLAAHLALLAAVAASARRLRPSRSLSTGAGLVLGVAGLAGALGPYRFASWLAVVDLAAILGVLVLGESFARARRRSVPWLLRVIVAAGLVQALLVLASRLLGTGGFAPGTLQNPSHAAAYLLAAFWALVAARSAGEKEGSALQVLEEPERPASQVLDKPERRVLLGMDAPRAILGAILLSAALLQASRGGLLALGVGGAVFLFLRYGRMSRSVRLWIAGTGLLALVAGGGILAYRFATKEDPYEWDRLRIWGVALKVASARPILGVGPGVFGDVTAALDLRHTEGPVHYAKHVEATHSDLLRIIAETGLLGSLAFLVLFVSVARRGIRALREGGGCEAALAAAVAGLLAQSAVENLSVRPAVSYTGAMLAAILLSKSSGPAGRPEPGRAEAWTPQGHPGAGGAEKTVTRGWEHALSRALLLYGGLLWAAIVFVIAPYLGYRSFRLFQKRIPPIGGRYASAIFWNPLQPDYRAELAKAVLAGRDPGLEDLRAGFLAVEEGISLKPIDAGFFLLKARLARRAFLAGGGESDWIAMADENYLRAIELDPHRPQARLERGWMVLDLDRPTAALQEADAALDSEQNSFEARRLRAAALIGLDRPVDARLELDEARRRHAQLAPYAPGDAYELAVLRWDEKGWVAIERRLSEGPGL